MQIILLSGGCGTRLWPLSNGTRSKQFLKVLQAPDGSMESMVQRVVRQIKESDLDVAINIATSTTQRDSVVSQLGQSVNVVDEPERRGTFPAIALSVANLAYVQKLDREEIVIVMPCDTFTEASYFDAVKSMTRMVAEGHSDLVVMAIKPTEPLTKFGYLVSSPNDKSRIDSFIEKPDKHKAEALFNSGACWNGGVFAFKLGYLLDIIRAYIPTDDFDTFLKRFTELPKISFDYEVAEKSNSLGAVYFDGIWKDLGSWDTLSGEMSGSQMGNVVDNNSTGTTIINELNIPVICNGLSNLIVAASPDGILVADKHSSYKIKDAVSALNSRPMYEERRWGTYKVVDNVEFEDGFCALTKQLTLNPGCSISYQRHECRDEIWTFIDGEGEIVIDGLRRAVGRGDVCVINRGQMHALRAITPLTFIEVQKGSNLVEEDIERFDYDWNSV